MLTKDLQSLLIYEKKYLLRRIGLEPIEITAQQRDGIVKSLEAGLKFVTIGEHVITLNAIQGVDPRYEPDNIPPRPKPKYENAYMFSGKNMSPIEYDENGDTRPATPSNKDELDQWDAMFASKRLEGGKK